MRAHHVDVARALCIVLVVFGHSDLAFINPTANKVLMTMRLPLFLMLAGAFFRPDMPLGVTMRAKGEALLKPYLSLALLYAPYYLFKEGSQELGSYALGVLSFTGKEIPGWLFPLWFLTLLWCLHSLGSVFISATRFHRLDTGSRLVWILALLFIGYGTLDWFKRWTVSVGDVDITGHGLPFNIELWPLCAAFFFLGFMFREDIRQRPLSLSLTAIAALVFGLTHALYQPFLNLYEHRYGPLATTTLAAVSGAITLIGIAGQLSKLPVARRYLSSLGQVNLYILMFHAPIVSLLQKALSHHIPNHEAAVWLSWAISIAASFALAKAIRATPMLSWLFERRDGTTPSARRSLERGPNPAFAQTVSSPHHEAVAH